MRPLRGSHLIFPGEIFPLDRVDKLCDLVLHPGDKADVKKILVLCHEKKIPVHVYSGGSSVTFGLTCPRGGVTLATITASGE